MRPSIRRIWIPRQTMNFMCRPSWRAYLSLETTLEDQVRTQLALGRQDYLEAGETGLEQISAERLQAFREIMER